MLGILAVISLCLCLASSFVWLLMAQRGAPSGVLIPWGGAGVGFLAFSLLCTYAIY